MNTKQVHLGISYSNSRKPKTEHSSKEFRGKRKIALSIEEQGWNIHWTSHQKPKRRVAWNIEIIARKRRKEKHQLRILYLVKLPFKSEKEIFSQKSKNWEFVTTRSVFQKMLKEVLQEEEKLYRSET